MTDQLEKKPCPFCGGEVDPMGWMGYESDSTTVRTGPECDSCGATAPSMTVWNTRKVDSKAPTAAEASTLVLTPVGDLWTDGEGHFYDVIVAENPSAK